MKKIKNLLFIFIIALITVSCDDDEPDQNSEQPGALVVTLEGDTIDTETIDFLYKPRAIRTTCDDVPCIWLEGSNSVEANKELSLSINNLTSTGTYVIGGSSDNFGRYETSPPGGGLVTVFSSSTEEGSLTVTSYEGNKIKGNFSFPAEGIVDNVLVLINISGTFDLTVSD